MPVVTEESEEKQETFDVEGFEELDNEQANSNSSGSAGVPGQEIGANEMARDNLNSILKDQKAEIRRRNSQ